MNRLLIAPVTCTVLAVFACGGWQLSAQDSTAGAAPADDRKASIDYTQQKYPDFAIRTYRLRNMTQQDDASAILTALRNILAPSVHVYMAFPANTIVLAAPPEQQLIAQSLLAKLDIPKATYRLTYTLTEMEDGKRVGTQHYMLAAADGQRVTLKQGSKVPVVTGVTGSGGGSQSQFQYLDVGMNFAVEADASGNGVLLKTKVEESSVPEERAIAGVQEPIIRQSVVESSSVIPFSKPFLLGSMDVLGSTRRMDVEVLVEPLNPTAAGH